MQDTPQIKIFPEKKFLVTEAGCCYTLSLISGKYKMPILYCLSTYKNMRYNAIKRFLQGISDKMLSQTLKELEADQLVIRTEHPQLPPKVEYSLSERGQSLIPIILSLCQWCEKNGFPCRHTSSR